MPHDFEKSYWNNRYGAGGNSGYGSYGDQLHKKLEWLRPLDFKTITEVGCGDFNFGAHILLEHEATYLGLDISDRIVRLNRACYPHQFEVFTGEIPPADLILCVDVLFHIIEDADAELMLQRLEKAWTKYLVLTAYERDEEFHNHVRIRKFDYKRFGEPLVREVVEEDGQLYFYIFKKDDHQPIPSFSLSDHQGLDLPERSAVPSQFLPFWRNTAPHSLRQSVS